MAARRNIFISVAEQSADMHAAALLRAAKTLLPNCRFFGLTGPRMRAAGAESLHDLTAHAAMLGGIVSVFGRALEAVRLVTESWQRELPALALLVDSPELHLRLATKARRMGIPVLYYIAPQTWASRRRRNKRIARDVDLLACILPFEEQYFQSAGVRARYVGHPLFETLAQQSPNEGRVRALRGGPAIADFRTRSLMVAARNGPLIALLPGSRRHVVQTMLPLQLAVIRELSSLGIEARVAISSAGRRTEIERVLQTQNLDAQIIEDDNASLLTAADLVLVASGTATLEVARWRRPMIVMYDAGSVLGAVHDLLGQRIVQTPHLSLVNILAGARVVPEFMPRIRDVKPIARVAKTLLTDDFARDLMIQLIDRVVAPLEATRPSQAVCGLIAELLNFPLPSAPPAPAPVKPAAAGDSFVTAL